MDLSDALIILGLILLGIGLFLFSPPIMFIIIGTVIFLIGILGAKNTPRDKQQKGGD
jgi:uncharacterized membrane protein